MQLRFVVVCAVYPAVLVDKFTSRHAGNSHSVADSKCWTSVAPPTTVPNMGTNDGDKEYFIGCSTFNPKKSRLGLLYWMFLGVRTTVSSEEVTIMIFLARPFRVLTLIYLPNKYHCTEIKDSTFN